MHLTSETVEALVEQLSKLPTIGRKSAQRLAAYVLKMPREEVVELAKARIPSRMPKTSEPHRLCCYPEEDRKRPQLRGGRIGKTVWAFQAKLRTNKREYGTPRGLSL